MVDSCWFPGYWNGRGKAKGRPFYKILKDYKSGLAQLNKSEAKNKNKQTPRWDLIDNDFRLCSGHFTSGTDSNVS